MEEIAIEIQYYTENYKNIKELYQFFLNYINSKYMEIRVYFTNDKFEKEFNYNEFFNEISKEKYKNEEKVINVREDKYLGCLVQYSVSRIYIVLEKEKYLKNSEDIDNFISKLFIETNGTIAIIEDADYRFIQNHNELEYFFKENILIDKNKIIETNGKKIIDITKNAGSTISVKGINIGVYWKMWIGHDYYNWLSKEDLSNFNNCYQNIELEDGSRKIIMSETLEDFISEKTDDIKWDFKRKMNLIAVEKKLLAIPEKKTKPEYLTEENIKIGNISYFLWYYDEDMKPIRRKNATKYYLVKHLLNEEGYWVSEEGELAKTGWLKNLNFDKLYKGEI